MEVVVRKQSSKNVISVGDEVVSTTGLMMGVVCDVAQPDGPIVRATSIAPDLSRLSWDGGELRSLA